ncbi:MAG: sigma-70 family RNA polymerase sigma factor [Phycisphaerae bacterium]
MQSTPIATVLAEELEEKWRRFREAAAPSERRRLKDELVLAHLWLVKQIAERLALKLPRSVLVDDLYQPGVIGLCGAVERYDATRPARFTTFATPVVFGAMCDSLRAEDWVPRLVRGRAKAFENASRRLRMLRGRPPTDREIAEEMGMEEEAYWKVRRDGWRVEKLSLSAGVAGSMEHLLKDLRAESPEAEAIRQDIKQFLTHGLDATERLVLVLYYYEDMTMLEISKALRISESRVSQLHSSIMARLKVRLAFTGGDAEKL